MFAIGKIVADTLEELCRYAQPGVTTRQLDDLALKMLTASGAESTPAKEYKFPGQLCISVNNEVVHGIPGTRILREGDLVKLDLTADKRGFVADATRMVMLPPTGALTEKLSDCAREACNLAIANAKPGMELRALGGIIQTFVTSQGFKVIKDLCGHGVGRHTHEEPEVPNYPDRTNRDRLKVGSVFTIEPIISAGKGSILSLDDGWTIVTADHALSAHYEETVILDENGCEIITKS